jgi:tetratricopeptide (TPR) repeat protein
MTRSRFTFARWLGIATFCVSGVISPTLAHAGGPTNEAAAAALFQEGKKLASAGDFEHACPKFVEAQRLFPTSGTLLNIGNCYEKLGKLASAWGAFKQAEVSARNQGDMDREREAQRRAEAVAPQLAKLAIVVPPAVRVPGFVLKQDGEIVGEGAWGTALPVDVGQHTIEATAPGYKPFSTVVRIESNGAAASFEISTMDKAPPPPPPASTWSGQRTAGLVLGGAGVIGLAISAGFTGKMAGKNSDSKEHCLPSDPNKCDATGVALRNEAFSASYVATGTAIAGGALITAGLIVFLTAPRRDAEKTERAALRLNAQPIMGPALAGLSINGVW